MLDREQIVTEIAQEVIARLSQQRAVSSPAPGRPAPRPVALRPPAITLGDGVFRTVDEAVQAAAAAQERVAAMPLQERGPHRRRHQAPLRGPEAGAGPGRARRDEDRPDRGQDRQARGDQAGPRGGGHAHPRPQRRLGPVRDRARAVGCRGDGPAGDPLRAHPGQQRDQRDRRRQHRGLQPAPRGGQDRGPGAAAVQPGDPAGHRGGQRPHHHGRAEHRGRGAGLPPPRRRPALR